MDRSSRVDLWNLSTGWDFRFVWRERGHPAEVRPRPPPKCHRISRPSAFG